MSKFEVGDIVHHVNTDEGTFNGKVIRIDPIYGAIVMFKEWGGKEWGMAGPKGDDNDRLLELIRKGGNTISNKFKVGDRVRIVKSESDASDNGTVGKIASIDTTIRDGPLYDLGADEPKYLYFGRELELAHDHECSGTVCRGLEGQIGNSIGIFNNKGDNKMSIVSRIRNLTQTKEQKLRIKYNIVNECGDRTGEGTDVLLDILFEQNAGEIDAKLAEIDKEDKADKKNK